MNGALRGGGGAASSISGLALQLAIGLPMAPLRELLRAARYAQDTGRPVRDFAVAVAHLRDQGLTVGDLRWLCCKGFLDFAEEASGSKRARGTRLKGSSLFAAARPAVVLTPQGVLLLEQVTARADEPHPARLADGVWPSLAGTPLWNPQLRELSVDDILVKRFLVPAENQELVLMAFQEEAWPPRIDDPLPPAAEIEPKRRLHSTIQCLNRNQKTHLLQFHGDGNGSGVRWELLAPRRESA